MKTSTKTCLVNTIALVAFVVTLGIQGVVADDPTTPMYVVGFSLSCSLTRRLFWFRFQGKLLIQNILDNSTSQKKKP